MNIVVKISDKLRAIQELQATGTMPQPRVRFAELWLTDEQMKQIGLDESIPETIEGIYIKL